ncbi:lipopolysaccharide-induced tumor necrosis factor-alpha factor homolog [Drosophila eugracilis]|uniref:lipopolysaccharide-induced tumor necrosis factor-alpha factor homolog n=1 Tax=Drosophila eugracilis TaxID=29029 RepID=UPI0007E72416|nr:lipopolysaccharide-induced tumor necrosis factor-alpha factor homolog [Drosophila eugracilis]
MDYKKIDSPPPYSDDFATAPPAEMDLRQYQAPAPQQLYPQFPQTSQVTQMSVPPPVNVVHHQTTVLVDTPGHGMVCPHCNARIRVRVERHPTGKTYCLAAFLCLFLCWPCVCAPCCCNCCYKTSQFCPNCNVCLGSF